MFQIIQGDCSILLASIEANSVRTCATSPPYFGLRDYKNDQQLGTEDIPEKYISRLVLIFREVRRVLTDDGTLWLNLGDSYAGNGTGSFRPGSGRADGKVDQRGQRNRNGLPCPPGMKPKDLMGIPWQVALALRDDGWFLRQDIIWHKTNAMPEPSLDRCTKAHEYLFLLSKSAHYYFSSQAMQEEGVNGQLRNRRSVWQVPTNPSANTNFATFPPALILPCILACSVKGDTVLDPFSGTGTTGVVALQNERHYIGIELNPIFAASSRERIENLEALTPCSVLTFSHGY